MTHPLIALGHEVVAVDESPDMLARIKRVETIKCRIENLCLPRRFDVVLLMSHLIENPDVELCRRFLQTCRRHVADSGVVLIQRDPPDRDYSTEPLLRTMSDGSTIAMRDLERVSTDVVRFTLDYQIGDSTWSQPVVTRRVSDSWLEAALASANLAIDGFLTPNRTWIRARPYLRSPAPTEARNRR